MYQFKATYTGHPEKDYVVEKFIHQNDIMAVTAMLLSKEMASGRPSAEIEVHTDLGVLRYRTEIYPAVSKLKQLRHSVPKDELARLARRRYLTCVEPGYNAYKDYEMLPNKNTFSVSYGRIGNVCSGRQSAVYKIDQFWKKYIEKINKGYVDRSDEKWPEEFGQDLVEPAEENEAAKPKAVQKRKKNDGNAAFQLFSMLSAYARKTVCSAKVNAPVNAAVIKKAGDNLDLLRHQMDVEGFNKTLTEQLAILQRPIGIGKGVQSMMAANQNDFTRIIEREEDLLLAMKGLLAAGDGDKDVGFSTYGVKVMMATDKQKEDVIGRLSPRLATKVKNIYRIIPGEQKKLFNDYLEAHDKPRVKMLWHGSRNENWLSIIQNSLSLNPNAVITGKMFGNGIYFAPSSTKSYGYTSMMGTYWAKGSSDTAFMGLYATAYGIPKDVHKWSQAADYERMVKNCGYNCLHAHAGASLKNDEIVFYDENAILLNYIVEFSA